MALTEVTNGTLAATSGGNSTVYSSGATPGVYVAKVYVGNYARTAPVVLTLNDLLADGLNTSEAVYQGTFPKGGDTIAYTPPLPTVNGFSLNIATPTAAGNIPWSVLTLGVPTQVSHGSLTMTSSAQQLGSSFGPGVYMCKVDLGNMANGDKIYVYTTDVAFSGQTAGNVWAARYFNAQRFPIKHTPPMIVQVTNGGTLNALQSAGTNRSVGYEILKLS